MSQISFWHSSRSAWIESQPRLPEKVTCSAEDGWMEREGRAEPILIKVAVMEDNLISGGEMRPDYPNHPPPRRRKEDTHSRG